MIPSVIKPIEAESRQRQNECHRQLVDKAFEDSEPLMGPIMSSACDLWECAEELQPMVVHMLRENPDKAAAVLDAEPALDGLVKLHHLAQRYVQLKCQLSTVPAAPPALSNPTAVESTPDMYPEFEENAALEQPMSSPHDDVLSEESRI